MTKIIIGEVDWTTTNLPGDNGGGKSDFMKLEAGDNKVRVLSAPQQHGVHWVNDETGKSRKVNCATSGCPVCLRNQDGDKPKASWILKVFNRKEGRVMLLEIGTQIFKGIRELVENKDWGPVSEYDITIKRGAPGAQPLYTVIPGRHAPVSGEEKKALEVFNERVDVARFINPPTPEYVAEQLGWDLTASTKTAVSNDFSSSVSKSKSAVNFDFNAE